MNQSERLQEDLAYVAATVRNECPPEIRSIYLLWAVLIPVGFALPDFAPQWASLYWMVVGPAGGVASWLIGKRSSEKSGIRDTRMGWRYGLHWGVATVAFLLAALPAVTGVISPSVMGANMLLIAGLVYLMAGIHMNRPMVYSGALMMLGYVLLYTVSFGYMWTTTGVIVGIALLVTGLAPGKVRGN